MGKPSRRGGEASESFGKSEKAWRQAVALDDAKESRRRAREQFNRALDTYMRSDGRDAPRATCLAPPNDYGEPKRTSADFSPILDRELSPSLGTDRFAAFSRNG